MSLSAYAHFNLTLSLDGSTVVHCKVYLLALYLLVTVVKFLVFSVLCTIGIFRWGDGMYCKFIH